jgi:serine protease
VSFPIRRPFRARWLAAAIALAVGAPALAAPAEAPAERFVVRFKAGTVERGNAAARQKVLDAVGRAQGLKLGQARRMALGADLIRSDRPLDAAQAKALRQKLMADPRVEYVVPERRMHRAFTPNDTSYAQQWHYFEAAAGIGANTAWDTTTGTGVVVAVLDTGITPHSDLSANVIAGYDFISDTTAANDGDGRDANASDPGDFVAVDECADGDPAENSSWHGTHVAGTIAAVTNNAKGVAGVAYGAKVQPVRVLGKCGGSTFDIAEAIVWAAGGNVPGVPVNTTPAEVLNLSLGGPGSCDPFTQDAINTAVGLGATIVVAAGNDAADASGFSPASCDNIVVVAAHTRTGARANFSNFGDLVDISAPGASGILSTINTGTTVPVAEGYALNNGTSMASPHVAGVAALMQSLKVHSPAMVERILKATARPFPSNCPLGCGTGMLTAPAALTATTQPLLYIDDPVDIAEGNAGTSTLTFTVSLSEAIGTDVTFDIATADGTATAGSDYVAKTSTAQVIPAGQTSKTFAVTVNGDTGVEPNETVLANVTNVTGITAIDTQAVARVMNDEAIVLANGVPISNLSAVADTETLYKITVPAGASNLTFATTGASGDADIFVRAGVPPTDMTFDCSSTSPTTTENCTVASPQAGTYYLLVLAWSDYTGVSVTASYTAPPPVSISIADASVAEGNAGTKVLTFTATLSAASASPVSYTIGTANGTATGGSDFVASTLAGQTIPAGQLSKTFSVTLNGDTAVEANETFLVNLSAVSGASIGDGQATGTIVNDDGATLSVVDASIAEGNAGTKLLSVTVKLSQAAGTNVTYNLATANGTATAGSDYTALNLSGLTIAAGATTATHTITLTGDTTVEANETILVNVTNVAGGASLLDGQGVATILNDDGPVLSIADVSTAEGNAGTKSLVFTVKLSTAATVPVVYSIATVASTATAGSDYVASSLSGQTIPVGQTSKTFSVTLNGDTTVEANEALLALITSASGATLLDDRATGNVLNDDGPTLSIADVSTIEGNSGTKTATFTVKLSTAAAVPVTYSIATANSSALAGTDYIANSLGGQSIPAGMLSKTFTVTINGDTTIEGNDTFFVNLSGVAGATVYDGQAAGIIVNDEGPRLTIGDVAVSEGNSGTKLLTFTISLTQAAAVPVTYNIATVNASAAAGSDYVAKTLFGESIAAGMLSKTFSVTVNGDTTVEGNEQFYVTMTNSTGASIYDGNAIGTISNDD